MTDKDIEVRYWKIKVKDKIMEVTEDETPRDCL
jgi:hypothetical protein